MSTASHVDILGATIPEDLSRIAGLERIKGPIEYAWQESAWVAFEQFSDGVWTASVWPLDGEGQSEALALAAAFRAMGFYAWAYIEDEQMPLDPDFGPREQIVPAS